MYVMISVLCSAGLPFIGRTKAPHALVVSVTKFCCGMSAFLGQGGFCRFSSLSRKTLVWQNNRLV